MTENEAIKVLVTQKQCIDKSSSGQCKIHCGDCKKNIPIAYQEKSYEVAITALKELRKYRKIGTVEECREAVERLEAKPVKNRKILRNFHGNPYGIQGDCPNCGCERITSMSTDWCHVCGQHLKYDENLEGMEDE